MGQGEAMNRKYKRLKLGDGQAYDRLANSSLRLITYLRHNLLHKPALKGNLCIPCINVT
jgi:hypothetical protein